MDQSWAKGISFWRNCGAASVGVWYTNIWFINGVDHWPPYRDWKADVSNVSPSSLTFRALAIRHSLWRRANARNVSFSISERWSIYIINSVDNHDRVLCFSQKPMRKTPASALPRALPQSCNEQKSSGVENGVRAISSWSYFARINIKLKGPETDR